MTQSILKSDSCKLALLSLVQIDKKGRKKFCCIMYFRICISLSMDYCIEAVIHYRYTLLFVHWPTPEPHIIERLRYCRLSIMSIPQYTSSVNIFISVHALCFGI